MLLGVSIIHILEDDFTNGLLIICQWKTLMSSILQLTAFIFMLSRYEFETNVDGLKLILLVLYDLLSVAQHPQNTFLLTLCVRYLRRRLGRYHQAKEEGIRVTRKALESPGRYQIHQEFSSHQKNIRFIKMVLLTRKMPNFVKKLPVTKGTSQHKATTVTMKISTSRRSYQSPTGARVTRKIRISSSDYQSTKSTRVTKKKLETPDCHQAVCKKTLTARDLP